MNVLVTGGAGYLGNSVIPFLLAAPEVNSVTIVDNLRRGSIGLFFGEKLAHGKTFRLVETDILDTRTLSAEVERCDVLLHMAAEVTTPFADHDAHRFEQVNHWGTAQLAHLVERHDTSRFIYVSSTAVYGTSPSESGIDTRPMPTTHYGVSKLRGEDHVRALHDAGRVSTAILRCGNAYGYNPGIRMDSVVNQFAFRAHHRQRIRILGDGLQHRSFIEVGRLGALIGKFVTGMYGGGTYNLTERNISIQKILEALVPWYPQLEYVFVDQNMIMRNLEVAPDSRIPELSVGLPSFQHDLKRLLASLSL